MVPTSKQNVPAGQSLFISDPVGQYEPFGQSVVADTDDNPVVGQYLPSGHGIAADNPVVGQYEPG